MKTILTSALLLFSFTLFSQAPPTLSFGLDKVLFGKGVIDVDLLTDIIAEKQDELKARIIEQEILEPVFKNTSFATKNYVFSVVRDLLREKDKNVLKKEVMEQTVNYAVIYAIAELFVEHSEDSTLNKILQLQKPEDQFKKEQGNFTSALFTTRKWKLPWVNYVDVRYSRQEKMRNDDTGDYDLEKVQNEIKTNNVDHKVKNVFFNDLLMDCILQAIITNDKLKSKGFFNKAFFFDLNQFKSMSYYHQYKDEPQTDCLYEEVDKFVDNIAELYESFELLEKYLLNDELGTKTFDLEKFRTKIEERFFDLSAHLRTAEIRALQDEIEEIKSDSVDMAYLRHTKSTYASIVDELVKDYPELGYPDQYFNDVVSFGDTIKGLKNELAKDLALINSTSLFNNKDSIGFMQTYEFKTPGAKNSTISAKFKALKKKYTSDISMLDEKIEKINNFDGVIFNDIDIENQTSTNQELRKKAIEALQEAMELTDLNNLDIDDLLDRLQSQLFLVAKNAELDLNPRQDSIIENLFQSYYHLKYNQHKTLNMGYISYLTNEVLPQVQALNIKAQGRLTEVSKLIEQIAILIERDIVDNLLSKLKTGKLSSQFEKLFERKDNKLALSFFLKFFEHLDRLDEIDTYYYLLEQLKVAGEQSDDRDIANAISLITKSVEKYSKFDANEERIDLNVELIIGALYDRYGNRDKNPLNFHLTLGLNNAFALDKNSLLDSEGNSIRNLGYASEKIGLRLNIYNFAMRHTYLPGEKRPRSKKRFDKARTNYDKEPLISNIHTMLYASGFLYQLADLGTTKNIQSTFIGAGFGTTFYNNLNFNVSYLLPLKYDGTTELRFGAINLGFDIYFGEYLTALNKKRKANKKAKLEAKYTYENAAKTSTVLR